MFVIVLKTKMNVFIILNKELTQRYILHYHVPGPNSYSNFKVSFTGFKTFQTITAYLTCQSKSLNLSFLTFGESLHESKYSVNFSVKKCPTDSGASSLFMNWQQSSSIFPTTPATSCNNCKEISSPSGFK